MKKPIGRRVFLRKSAVATAGAMVFPASYSGTEDSSPGPASQNGPSGNSGVLSKINWKELMKNHDLIWKKIPTEMTEAPHLGNGLIGYFLMKPKGEITHCDLRLDIYQAELAGSIFTSLGSLKIEHLVHRHDDVIYTRMEASGGEEVTGWEWHPFEARGSRGGKPGDKTYGQAYAPYKELKNPEHRVEEVDEIFTGIQDLSAGGDYATAWKEERPARNSSALLITIQNSYPGKTSAGDAVTVITQVQKKIDAGPEKWIEDHRTWWHDYYPESFVTFPDTTGQTFYWNNVYRLACCTRPGAQYIDTPGMWNSGGPWP